MTFEGGIFLFLGLLFILPALYWLSRLVNWVAGRKLIPLWLLAALTVAALAGGSLYLDAAGIITPVKILDKNDTISLGRNGSWGRNLSVQVEYQSPGEYTPTPIGLRCDAATFDALRIGQTVDARVLDLGQVFKFARLKDRSTFSLIGDRFPRSPRGPWRESTAVISEVTHIAEYSTRRSSSQLPWPFDIVQLSFTPDGRDQPVIAVDVVESASAPGLVKGGTVRIVWPEDDPRSATIKGARPGSPWANWFYGLAEILAIGAAVIAFFVVIGLRRRKRRAKERIPTM
jgi:hypothetical protein